MSFWTAALEALVLVTALSLDAFAASFAYGAGHIKIPLKSACLIDLICATLLSLGLLLSGLLSPHLPTALTQGICFGVLFLLGIVKLCDSTLKTLIKKHTKLEKNFRFSGLSLSFILSVYANPEKADQDSSQELTPKEAAALAVALSLDGLASGFGAGLNSSHFGLTLLLALIIGILAILLGCHLGNRLSGKTGFDLSWLSGLMLIALAFFKLV